MIEELPQKHPKKIEVSVVMPCLNEILTVGICIQKAQQAFQKQNLVGEIIIADNGSTDGSQELAVSLGAKVVNVQQKGYGAALMGGIEATTGDFIVMGDSDDSYDWTELGAFVLKLREGYDLVMGNRFKGGIQPNAMPFLNRYLGNPVLSFVGQVFFSSDIGDFHCGMRGFTQSAYSQMQLRTTGMEFATEMVVKATLQHLKITEIPIHLYPDGRNRPPHLRRWRDGWRHLRFMALYAPAWTLLYPGTLLMLIGGSLSLLLLIHPLSIFNLVFDTTTLLYTCLMVLIGFQLVLYYYKVRIYAVETGLFPTPPNYYTPFHYFTLERGLIAAAMLISLGICFTLLSLQQWQLHAWGNLSPQQILRLAIPAMMFLFMGVQLFLSSIFFSILGLQRKSN